MRTSGEQAGGRRGTVVVVLAASLLSGCDARGMKGGNPGSPPSPAVSLAAATAPPTQGQLTPRTETPAAARVLSRAFTTVAAALRPCVVRVDVEHAAGHRSRGRGGDEDEPFGGLPPMLRHFFDFGEGPEVPELPSPSPVVGTGSGFVLDTSGVVMTNSHVVEGGAKFKVTFFDGQEIDARVVGKDRRTDVALVRLERIPQHLTVARLGDSNKLEVGEWVLAVGSPLGLDQTVTAGIVSGLGRVGRNVQMSGDRVFQYIQTDAKINPGNSGGPLVNLDGEVIGINTLIRVGAGGAYGFAVPINQAFRVAQILLKDGRVRYPFLGVNLRDLRGMTDEMKQQLGGKLPDQGALVVEVTPGSPAAKVGIQQGDIITKLDHTAIRDAEDVVSYVTNRAIGDPVQVTIMRGRDTKTFRAVLAEAPSEAEATGETPRLGLSLQTLTPTLAESLGLPSDTHGAAITDVGRDSPAARAGLHAGEVIVEIDHQGVATADAAVSLLRAGQRHLLRVRGPAGFRFVTIGG